MPLLTPRDADAFPVALGALKRPDPPQPPDLTALRPVAGRLHLFVDGLGRMAYQPPKPPPSLKEPFEKAASKAEEALGLKPATQAPAKPAPGTKPRPDWAPSDATHIGISGAVYKAGPGKYALKRAACWNEWRDSHFTNQQLIDPEPHGISINPLVSAFTTIPHTDPKAKDVPWITDRNPPADFKGWLMATMASFPEDHDRTYYWDGQKFSGSGSTPGSIASEAQREKNRADDYITRNKRTVLWKPVHPVFPDQS